MGALDGRVAIVTGAGRGLGREHALLLAAEGASVVVNDVGSGPDGLGVDPTLADTVAGEIRDLGGHAIPSTEDVADWDAAGRLVRTAIDAFGELHILVNNAGILRDRFLVTMSEEEWDAVVRVHLKGHFAPLRHAAAHWRDRANDGRVVAGSVVNTSSTSGLYGNPGQSNYGAAKAGIAALTTIAASELDRFGVRVNAIAPAARTRLTESTPGLGDIVAAPPDDARFDEWDPANVSPLVGWLSTAGCPVTGQTFYVFGGEIAPMGGWARQAGIARADRWTVDAIDCEMRRLL
jgi:NAD(P)-dependent dehydrogenase (short-subunit alcohol dehydrogenase family)